MNIEQNDSVYDTPIRQKPRKPRTSPSTPSTPCSQSQYLFHDANELQQLYADIASLEQNIKNLLEENKELKQQNEEFRIREKKIAASITFINRRPTHHNVKTQRQKHRSKKPTRMMCWKRRYATFTTSFINAYIKIIK